MKEFENNRKTTDTRIQTSSGEESEILGGSAEYHIEKRDPIEKHSSTREQASIGLRSLKKWLHGSRMRQFLGWKGFATLRKALIRIGHWFKRHFGRYVSPVFLLMLMLSFGMWYMIKLSHTYITDIQVHVNIEGHEIVVTCMAEGEGTDLLFGRDGHRRKIYVAWSDLEVTPSSVNQGFVVVSPHSLQNAISINRPDLKITSVVGQIPEIKL